jgi:hypothetical protein
VLDHRRKGRPEQRHHILRGGTEQRVDRVGVERIAVRHADDEVAVGRHQLGYDLCKLRRVLHVFEDVAAQHGPRPQLPAPLLERRVVHVADHVDPVILFQVRVDDPRAPRLERKEDFAIDVRVRPPTELGVRAAQVQHR